VSGSVRHGDLFDVLPTLAAESVDACVTDPPYGIGFMGREWDTFKPGTGQTRKLMHPREREAAKIVPDNPNLDGRWRSPALSPSQIDYDYTVAGLRGFQEWSERWASEVLRVMKPGGYLVVCGAPRSYHRMACGLEDAGFVIRDKFAWLFGSGFPKNHDLGDGKGTALKPAHEPIALAWKPFKGSIKACHAKYGTAALNIEACRIGDKDTRRFKPAPDDSSFPHSDDNWEPRDTIVGSEFGRWPANVVIDEVAAEAIDAQTGELGFSAGTEVSGEAHPNGIYGSRQKQGRGQIGFGDAGGASRFYYCAKPSRDERDMGCHGLAERQRDESRKEGNPGGDNPRNRGLQPRGNFHPTVKPIDLMRWLVRLVTPEGGTVLDPFTGSGTTGCACAYEARQFIGIEREADYIQIAERRIAACLPLFAEARA
jgi:DNA modification methylase